MPPGRKPKTNAQKRAKGETRPSRQNKIDDENIIQFPQVDDVPEAPEWIYYDDGFELWNEIAPQLYKQKVLTKADVYALAHLCFLHGELVDNSRRGIGSPSASYAQLRLYFNEFGMTPASRTRVPSGEKGKGKFGNNGKR